MKRFLFSLLIVTGCTSAPVPPSITDAEKTQFIEESKHLRFLGEQVAELGKKMSDGRSELASMLQQEKLVPVSDNSKIGGIRAEMFLADQYEQLLKLLLQKMNQRILEIRETVQNDKH